MKANCWIGKKNVRVEQVPDPKILNQSDAIIKVTSTAICGSDLHLFNGMIPTMERGDILGHEFMGEVVETGRDVKKLKKGDRVVVPFPIRVRRVLLVSAEDVFSMRELKPECMDCGEGDGAFAFWRIWLLSHARRVCRWSGRVCSRPLC